jgi:hypothetical protein
METLAEIQQALRAPKSQTNAFGKYKYRSCEDILTAVKPLLGKWSLIITDEVVLIGDRYYVKATAKIYKGNISWSADGLAREPLNKKGADESQITGAASSYARKYALNGLFAIDDTKDADATNDHKDKPKLPPTQSVVLKKIAAVKAEDEPSLLDFMSSKGLTGKDVLELNERGLQDLLKDINETFK